jgi:hypothetical protein
MVKKRAKFGIHLAYKPYIRNKYFELLIWSEKISFFFKLFLFIDPCTVRVCGQTEEAGAIKIIILIKI